MSWEIGLFFLQINWKSFLKSFFLCFLWILSRGTMGGHGGLLGNIFNIIISEKQWRMARPGHSAGPLPGTPRQCQNYKETSFDPQLMSSITLGEIWNPATDTLKRFVFLSFVLTSNLKSTVITEEFNKQSMLSVSEGYRPPSRIGFGSAPLSRPLAYRHLSTTRSERRYTIICRCFKYDR